MLGYPNKIPRAIHRLSGGRGKGNDSGRGGGHERHQAGAGKDRSAYMESFNRQDAAGIAALYANGGMHINPAGPRTDIEQLYQAIFKAGFDHQETNLDEAWPLGTDAALAIGQYRIAGKDPTGAPMERGRLLDRRLRS